MAEDLLSKLQIAASIGGPGASKLYREAISEIRRCHERLEIDHYYKMPPSKRGEDLVRVEAGWEERFTMPDAVEARDATISLLETRIEELSH